MVQLAEERITKSRVRLLLGKPFFGQLATRFKLIEMNDISTAATDGRNFYFNREFINQLPDGMIDYLVGHEVLHMVFDHMGARGDRDPNKYNQAADFNINMTLVDENIGTVITEEYLSGGKPCLDWKYKGMNSYEIYDILVEENDDTGCSMDVHLDPNGSSGDGDGEGDAGSIGQMTEEERKALQDEIKQAVIQAAQGAGGDVPESIKRMIQELVAPKMDWKDILCTQLESSLQHDFTFMRPSKRSGEVIFPGMNKDELLRAFIALDLSGSIGHDLAKEMLSEVQGIMDQYADYEIHVCCFDTRVYNYEIFSSEDGRSINDYELKGGGGTDFDAVFNFLAENDISPHQLVMFTDGYPWGSWGNEDYCDTLFVIHGDTAQRIQAPFGVTVHYE